ncbi:PD-(D/E)XK nuclease family protein [Roseateles sp. BYS87W]|uniref:PD-(D/E)XK nuclease family protein n=1 Tax=Pelomonas baiyunensis TaxID=3299026 RepID=A0ABW7H2E3_9BURK
MKNTKHASPAVPSAAQIKKFREDPQVAEFRGGITSRSLLEITDPREVRHARILHWLFNPLNEHELGDGAIRALLRAAAKADGDRAGELNRLAKLTWKEAVVCREYRIGNRSCDLVIANPKQRVILAIEFKTGAKLSPKQLADYEKGLKKEFPADTRKGEPWQFVGVLLDSESRNHVEAMEHGWIPLDLSWLVSFLSEHKPDGRLGGSGKQALRDYLTYLERHAREHDQRERLITGIAMRHETVVRWMGRLYDMDWNKCIRSVASDGRRAIDAWYLSDWEHWQEVVDHLPFAPIYAAAHQLGLTVDEGRTTACLYDPRWDAFKKSKDQGSWPVYLLVEPQKNGPAFRVRTIGWLEKMSTKSIKRLADQDHGLTRDGLQKKWTALEKTEDVTAAKLSNELKTQMMSVDERLG